MVVKPVQLLLIRIKSVIPKEAEWRKCCIISLCSNDVSSYNWSFSKMLNCIGPWYVWNTTLIFFMRYCSPQPKDAWMSSRLSLKLSVGKVLEERSGWTMLCWPRGPVKRTSALTFKNLRPGFTLWTSALTDTCQKSLFPVHIMVSFLWSSWKFSHGLATGRPHKHTDTWCQGKVVYNRCMHVYSTTVLLQ